MSETNAAAPAPTTEQAVAPRPTSAQSEMTRITNSLPVDESGVLLPKTFQEQWAIASAAFNTGLIPTKNTAETWLIMQRGSELGFPLLTAVEFLYPVDGKLRLSPDGAKAKALESSLLEDWKEYYEGPTMLGPKGEQQYGDTFKAVCWVKRRGVATPIVREFSVAEAKTARLWPGFERGQKIKQNWEGYPQRMLSARARGWAFQDAFRDVTGGLQVRERFDLDAGERIGGVTVAPPDARNITPTPSASGEKPKPARVTFSAPLVVDAEVVPEKSEPAPPERAQCCERDHNKDGNCDRHPAGPETKAAAGETIEAPSETPVQFDEARALAALRGECDKRTGGDVAAAGDLFREILAGVASVEGEFGREGLEVEGQFDDAMAAVRQHPVFGDAPPVLTSPPADSPKKGKR